MYRHFIFDIDGTLIDTEKTGILSLMDTVRDLMGREMPYDEAYPYFGIPSNKVGPLLGYEDNERFCHEWEQNFIRLSNYIQPFEGVSEILREIKAAGRTIGCVTSRNRFEFNKDEHLKKMLCYFDHTICSEDSEKHKPDPDPMYAYMKKAEDASGQAVDPKECIFIGDTMHDWQCGHSAGCDFALADWRSRGLQGIPAEFHFQKTEEILTLLECL